MALTPLALIPQVILGGLLVPATTHPQLQPFMWLTPAYWGFAATGSQQRLSQAGEPAWNIAVGNQLNSLPDFIESGVFHCAEAQVFSLSLPGAWALPDWISTGTTSAILAGFIVLFLLLVGFALKRRGIS